MIGSCAEIPLPDSSIDVVVSFETIEHHDQHEMMMKEIKRVLRKDGVLLISSPDKYNYTIAPANVNPHHVKELYAHEFKQLIESNYKNVCYFGQRIIYGSGIFIESGKTSNEVYQLENGDIKSGNNALKPVYWIALASDVELPTIASGILDQPIAESEITRFWRDLMANRDAKIGELQLHEIQLQHRLDAQALEHEIKLQNDLNTQKSKFQHIILQREAHVAELEKANFEETQRIQLYNYEIEILNQNLSAVFNSRSWKLTSPLRSVVTNMKNLSKLIAQKSLKCYRKIPLSYENKILLKNSIFRVFGFALKNWAPYTQWKSYQDIQCNWPTPTSPISNEQSIGSISSDSNHFLPNADGYWEWADYTPTKHNIEKIKASNLANAIPKPWDMIEIGKETLISAAARVNLPCPSEHPDVSIIIPVFNNVKLTLECLLSISKYPATDINYEVIVADDASTDETAEIISSISHIRYLRNATNLGFLLNCNNALKTVHGERVLYLNNDVQVTEGWLNALQDTFTSHPNVGAVGPRMIYPSGHLQEAGATIRPDGTAEMIGLNEDPEQDRFSYVRRVDYVSGACLLMPTDLAKKIGGFSEEFLPCYCEDSDLCLSVQKEGFDVYYNPAATIIHHLSKTTAAVDQQFKMRCIYKNQHTLQNKWSERLNKSFDPKLIAFYLPQFHPFPQNDNGGELGLRNGLMLAKQDQIS